MEKGYIKRKYIYIEAIITVICFFIVLFLFKKEIPSNNECKEITDTIFVYRRDTIILLPSQNIEDIKKNLNVIKK